MLNLCFEFSYWLFSSVALSCPLSEGFRHYNFHMWVHCRKPSATASEFTAKLRLYADCYIFVPYIHWLWFWCVVLEVVTAVAMKSEDLRVVTPCTLRRVSHFGGTYHLHL
jgi:hypothetical protein